MCACIVLAHKIEHSTICNFIPCELLKKCGLLVVTMAYAQCHPKTAVNRQVTDGCPECCVPCVYISHTADGICLLLYIPVAMYNSIVLWLTLLLIGVMAYSHDCIILCV